MGGVELSADCPPLSDIFSDVHNYYYYCDVVYIPKVTAAGKQSGAPLAALANVAGLLRALPFAECTDAEIEKTMAVNFYGPCRLVRHTYTHSLSHDSSL